MRFDSHLNVLLTAAVGLVNAVTPGHDGAQVMAVPDGAERATAVGRVLVSRGRPAVVTPAEGAELASYANTVRAVFVASAADEPDVAARLVNELLLRTGARPQLDHGPDGWGLHFHGSDDSVVIGWAAGIASALAICAGQRPGRRPRCLRSRPLRPGVRRHLQERHPTLLLHPLPEPRQGRSPPSPPVSAI